MPLISIPNGTIDILAARVASPSIKYTPAAAGTIVDGIVPRTPPTRPPNLSIATVTKIATRPANAP